MPERVLKAIRFTTGFLAGARNKSSDSQIVHKANVGNFFVSCLTRVHTFVWIPSSSANRTSSMKLFLVGQTRVFVRITCATKCLIINSRFMYLNRIRISWTSAIRDIIHFPGGDYEIKYEDLRRFYLFFKRIILFWC